MIKEKKWVSNITDKCLRYLKKYVSALKAEFSVSKRKRKMFFLAFVTFATCSLCFYVYRRFYCHRYFQRLGIPGPKVDNFFFGNSPALWRDDRHLVINQWVKEFGPVFGYYEGPSPVLVIADASMAETFLSKQSSQFTGRYVTPFQVDAEANPDDPTCSLFMARDRHWRKPRLAASGFFSRRQLRETTPILLEMNRKLKKHISQNGEIQNLRTVCQKFALQYMSLTAFRVDLKLDFVDGKGKGNKNEFGEEIFKSCDNLFKNIVNSPPKILRIVEAMPILADIALLFVRMAIKWRPEGDRNCEMPQLSDSDKGLFNGASNLLGFQATLIARKRMMAEQRQAKRDLVQILSDVTERLENGERRPFLSDRQIRTNLMGMLMAGYETSGTAMAMMLHLLAGHPECQQKLFEEELAMASDEELSDYDYLMEKMPYLDAAFKETLRLYPLAVYLVNRLGPESDQEVFGLRIPSTLKKIQIDTYSIHHSEGK